MARPVKPRRIGVSPPSVFFLPQPVPVPPAAADFSLLTIDELEALRLADLQGCSHEEAAGKMNISRATFGRIVARARRKTAYALVYGKGIGIAGGVIQPVQGPVRRRHGHGRGPR